MWKIKYNVLTEKIFNKTFIILETNKVIEDYKDSKTVDKIVEWCKRYKEYRIKRSLPNGMTAQQWVKEQNQHKNADDCQ